MPAKTETAAQAAWPEGVIARYLTVAGVVDPAAYVEITASTTAAEPFQQEYMYGYKGRPQECINLTLTAECNGCKDNDEVEYEQVFATALDRVLESSYGREAQRWAQAHAEKCRAMPRPAGE